MSILIRNMAMPKNCKDCIFCVNDWCVINSRLHRTKEETTNVCPLIEIPPHGRLIDADALLQHQWVSSDWNCGGVHEIVVSITDIDDAPTIIESEGEE